MMYVTFKILIRRYAEFDEEVPTYTNIKLYYE